MKMLGTSLFVAFLVSIGGTALAYDYADQIDCSVDGEHVYSFDINRSSREAVTLDCGMQVTCDFHKKTGGGDRPVIAAKLVCKFHEGRAVHAGASSRFHETSRGISGSLDQSLSIPGHDHTLSCRPASF